MPWYRFIEEARVILHFRNGDVRLDFANLGEAPMWAWVAYRSNSHTPEVILHRTGNMLALRVALMTEGFETEVGGAADRLMRAAVKCGLAEDLPDDPRWRREIILARHRYSRG